MTSKYQDIHREVIELCKTGNRKAQFELYQLYSKAMYNICYRMMNNQTEAEDILQDAFTEAFINLNTFRYESSFGAWLKRIVVNRCINQIKKRKVDLYLTDNLKSEEYVEEEQDSRDYKLEISRVQKAVELLPDGYRVILTLYLFEGYDHMEIAQIMNISESTSKSQYLRAKKRVLELLKN